MLYLNMFNTREIASGIWAIIFLFWALSNLEVRKSISNFIKILFNWKIVLTNLSIAAYLSLIVYILSKFHFGDISLLKDTILWYILSAIALCNQAVTESNNFSYFKNIIKDNFKIMLLLEFIVNFYTFNIIIEIILVPIVTLIALSATFADGKEEYKSAKKLLDVILIIFGLFIVFNSIYLIISQWNGFTNINTLESFFTPIIYTLAFIPFAYILKLISEYEIAFIKLSLKNIKSKRIKLYLKARILFLCNFDFTKIQDFIWYFSNNFESLTSFKQVNDFFSTYKKHNTPLPFDENTKGFNPTEACHYLDSQEICTGKYIYLKFETEFGNYSCCSPYKTIDNLNNIAYYLEGDNQAVKKLYLVLNVYKDSNKAPSHNFLIESAGILFKKALNEELNREMIKSLKKGKPNKWQINDYEIIIEKEKFKEALLEYELRFIIQAI